MQRRAISARRGSAAILRQIIDGHPAPMLIAALADRRLMLANGAAIRLLGLAASEQRALSLDQFRSGTSDWAHLLERLTGDGGPVPAVFRFAGHADRSVAMTANTIQFEGEAAALILLRQDEPPAAYGHRSREEFLEAALEALPVGVFIKDIQDGGRYVLFNAASGQIAGRDARDIIGTVDAENGFGPLAQRFREEDLRAVADPASWIVSEATIHPEGTERIVRTIKRALAPAGDEAARFVLGVSYDITEARSFEKQLAHLAQHDALTGLATRDLFLRELEALVTDAAERPVALLCVDIDNFKSLNDRLGHHAGDLVLREVATRLAAFAGEHGIAARMGGDEFAVALAHPAAHSIDALAGDLYAALARPIVVEGVDESVTVSIGALLADRQGDLDDIRKNADLALYAAKKEGRARFRVYEPLMRTDYDRRENLTIELRRAVAEREFVWHYQPIVALADYRISAVEALVRWNHPLAGMLSPGVFIDVAEQNGLIGPIGDLMLEAAFPAARLLPEGVRLALNLSVRQLQDDALPERFAAALRLARLSAKMIDVEVTESIFLSEQAGALENLERLRRMGVSTAIDDFGVGYSSLSYLRMFPFDRIKLDASFISGSHTTSGDEAIVAAVAGIAAGFGLAATGEGVEMPAQLERLRAAGFHEAQGFLFGAAVPQEELPQLLATGVGALAAPGGTISAEPDVAAPDAPSR